MPKYDYFVAHKFTEQEKDDLRVAIENAFKGNNLSPYYADQEVRDSGTHILDKIIEKIRETKFGIFDITDGNSNVCLELGLAKGLEKTFFIICNKKSLNNIPSDLTGLDRIDYGSYKELTNKIKKKILPNVLEIKNPHETTDKDDKLIKILSDLNLTEQDILDIEEGKKEDQFQKVIDEINKSINNEELYLYRKFLPILDNYWNNIREKFNETSDTRVVSDYFGDHYNTLIFKLIEKQADFKFYYPILKSLDDNVTKLFQSKSKLSEESYLSDITYFSNVFTSIIEKSIEKSNADIFKTAMEMFIEHIEINAGLSLSDFDIQIDYINNLDNIIHYTCEISEKKIETDFFIDHISVKYMHVGKFLLSHELFESLEYLLHAFESVIVFELTQRKEKNLIITERSLMYLWIYCQYKNPKISEKIISILNKVCSKKYFIPTLLTAYSKTEEWLKDDEYKTILRNINKQIECLSQRYH